MRGANLIAVLALALSAFVVFADSGFTPIVPSPDSRVIYVSASAGDDARDCLSAQTACKSIKAGLAKMRDGYPDHLLLRRGDVWRNELLGEFRSGRSAKEPAVVAFYGADGDRPKLESGNNIVHAYTLKNAAFFGVEFSNQLKVFAGADFTGLGKGEFFLLGPVENILIEDCVFNHIELVAQKWTSGNPVNLTLRRNIWTGAYFTGTSFSNSTKPSNVYLDGVDGLVIEENVFDFGGWHPAAPGAGANMFNHNLYIQSGTDGNKLVLRNNIISRGGSHGAQLRGGGEAEANFFGRNAIGLLLGYSQVEMPAGTRAHAINNVVSEGGSMFKGLDACRGSESISWKALCTGAVFGIDINLHGDADYVSTGNIVSGRAPDDTKWAGVTSLNAASYLKQVRTDADKVRVVKESGNIAWEWSGAAEGHGPDYQDPGRTLGDYNQSLGGANSYDEFMQVAKSRKLQTWDDRYTAASVNRFIRAGYSIRAASSGSSSSSSSSSASSASSSGGGISSSSSSSSSGGSEPVVIEMRGRVRCTVESGEVVHF